MMGSAAMLCGFKRMSMAVVLFIAECGDDWDLIPPLMLTVTVSLMLNRIFLKSGFDEEQMMRKHIPFLEPEPHEGLNEYIAKDFIDETCTALPRRVSIEVLESLLQNRTAYEIPVLDNDSYCIGFTTQTRLRAALKTLNTRRRNVQQVPHADGSMNTSLVDSGSDSSPGEVCLEQLVDRSPYKVDEDMPAQRVYELFAKAGINS